MGVPEGFERFPNARGGQTSDTHNKRSYLVKIYLLALFSLIDFKQKIKANMLSLCLGTGQKWNCQSSNSQSHGKSFYD